MYGEPEKSFILDDMLILREDIDIWIVISKKNKYIIQNDTCTCKAWQYGLICKHRKAIKTIKMSM